MKHTEIIEALKWRYAVKAFDTTKKVSEEDVAAIVESGRLAPSAFGLEPWKFILVKNPEIRQKLRAAGYDQPKIADASHLVVIAARTDGTAVADSLIARTAAAQGKSLEDLAGFQGMVSGAVAAHSQSWFDAQTYIPLGMMMETASMLGVDNAAMEGFDPAAVGEILGLEAKNLKAVTMLALGYRSEDDAYAALPKVRQAYDEVVEVIE
ncbi:MAG: NAD(P)H-dependent oxidoreductase [Patescibacteria group bacterium]